MMRRRRPIALLCLVAALAIFAKAGAAMADPPPSQEQPPPADSEIVVLEERAGSGDAAQDFLKSIEFGRLDLQAARWTDRICPKVMGVQSEIADQIVGRIEAVAERTGVDVATRGCKTNITIVFVDNGADFMQTLRRRSPRRLKEIPKRKQDFVFESDAPVRWWYKTEVTGSGGRPLLEAEPPFVKCEGQCNSGSVLPSNEDTKFLSHYNSSRITSPTERYIRNASVVIDISRVSGTAVDSIADYVALITLSEIWPESGSKLSDSILSLFNSPNEIDAEIATLSDMDRQFLCELYRMPLDRPANYQKKRALRAIKTGEILC